MRLFDTDPTSTVQAGALPIGHSGGNMLAVDHSTQVINGFFILSKKFLNCAVTEAAKQSESS